MIERNRIVDFEQKRGCILILLYTVKKTYSNQTQLNDM